jgi:hypothetical protein
MLSPSNYPSFDHSNNVNSKKLWSCSLCNFLHSVVTSLLFSPNIILTNLLYITVHHCICFALVPMSNELFWLCYSGCGSHVLPVLGTLSYATALLCLWETLTQLWQDKRMGVLYHRSVVTFITFSLLAPTISLLINYTIYVYTENMGRLNIPKLTISWIPPFNPLLILWWLPFQFMLWL